MDHEPVFPVDLEREIFETTALMHPKIIPKLLLVARRIHIRIEPLLYRVLHLGIYDLMPDIFLTTTKTKPPGFFHGAVRQMYLESSISWSQADVQEVLSLCSGLVPLEIVGKFVNPRILRSLGQMRLQRLSVRLEALFGGNSCIDLTHPLFDSITHLDIYDEIGEKRILTRISALPALTHLCFNEEVAWGIIRAVLRDCPRLELLANFCSFPGDVFRERAQDPPVRDVRFVMGMYADHWIDYDVGVKGLSDFWSVLDDFVAGKRSGAIPVDCYWCVTGTQ
ncbi:hypothetical protein B0H10DRAFT_2083383 [Mycena sp. CBHHK59/15]|nr:hypothetical protein B0H10DRAFT_2083383 [Mycena sp. CBHHK59/15]